MSINSLISIVVPAYNVGPYIERCLNSILNQTYTNIEIIVIEQASEDDTLLKTLHMREKDSRIKLILSYDIKSAGFAKNLGIMASNGDYLCLIDSDDYIDPTMIEELYNAVKSNNAEVSACNYFFDNFETGELEVNEHDYSFLNFVIYQIACNKLYSKKFLFEHGIFYSKLSFGDDTVFTFSVMALAKNIAIVDKPLYYYVLNRPGSLTTHVNVSCIQQLIDNIQAVIDFFEKKCLFEKYRDELECAIATIILENNTKLFFTRGLKYKNVTVLLDYLNELFPRWKENPLLLQRTIQEYTFALLLINIAEVKNHFQENVIIFSSSSGGQQIYKILKGHGVEVKAFVDNDKNKQGTYYDDIKIISPDEILKYKDASVVIGTAIKYNEEITEQLLQTGVNKKNIFVVRI